MKSSKVTTAHVREARELLLRLPYGVGGKPDPKRRLQRQDVDDLASALAQRTVARRGRSTSTRQPDEWSLILLWLQVHFAGRPAVVFDCSDFVAGHEIARQHFAQDVSEFNSYNGFTHGETKYRILPVKTARAAMAIVYATPDGRPDAWAWSGRRALGSNS